ncbi:MAG: ATP-dependent DNA helicase RecG [Allobaculum sp.]
MSQSETKKKTDPPFKSASKTRTAQADLNVLKLTDTQKKLLEHKNITTYSELIHTYPLRYTHILPAGQWQEGDEVLFEGTILQVKSSSRISKGRIVTRLSVWFDHKELDVSIYSYGYFPSVSQEESITICGIYHAPNSIGALWTSKQSLPSGFALYPNYSMPPKMRRDTMIRIIDKALKYVDRLPDRVPASLRSKYRLLDQSTALRYVHQPQSEQQLYQAVRSLKYEEFLSFHCARLMQSERVEKTPKVFDTGLIEAKIQELPYPLTPDQRKAIDQVLSDMRDSMAMYRLLQGDVGCGKTTVAALAAYACALSGQQCALLAPTEILARQHVKSLTSLGIESTLYCSSLKAAEKRRILSDLKEGKIQIIVGTHSLFQEGVEYSNLGLVIADEQQRFGVLQRRALIEKGHQCDVLLMSATPIPRTAAHFLYGDIDLSVIRTMPPGRMPVRTKYFRSSSMKPVLGRILEGIEKEGRQVYVVCPAIEENLDEDTIAAKKIYDGMVSVFKSRIQVGLLHGKMKTEEKEAIMQEFKEGKIQILVSTTVIEVGIDVANATMMVIYDAHRFGLSTLHQLRGRCARGSKQGECYLLSSSKTAESVSRLKKMEELDNGFDLSAYDLHMRGPGDLLGTRQSGLPAFILGDASKDLSMMDCCANDAKDILAHPENEENRAMMAYLHQAMNRAIID